MQKKICITFNSAWVLEKKDEAKLPVETFIDTVKQMYDVEVLSASLTECEVVVNQDITEFEILDLIKKTFSIDDLTGVAEYSVSDYLPQLPSVPDFIEKLTEQFEKDMEDAAANRQGDAKQTLDKINALIGAEEFKALAEECVKVAPGLIKHNTVEAFTHQCYIFAINDGNGLTTYLELFAQLLSDLKLFAFDEHNRIAEEKIPSAQSKDANAAFSSVYGHFRRFGKKTGKIISIDISEWMSKLTDKSFRDFLSRLDDRMGENIIVFRVPFVEKEILNGMRKALGDVLFVRDISFVPFDSFELTKCAENSLDKLGFTMEADAWDVFNARITEEKNDGRFYGINTVNKVIREMIYRKQLDNALHDIDDTLIKKSEILGLATSYADHEKTGFEQLDEFIGMEQIRARVEEIVAQIEMSAKKSDLGHPCIHMRFVGNPGTGKTTVARVIGKILKEKGILRNGNFFEYSGRDFCGRYIGETAPKTAAMCRDAYGSVMFIDEAYSLYRGDEHGSVDYGREAIDTLIAEMENHRTDLVVIMAGYTDEMDTLMKANAGLESRMPYVVEFPNYTREQLRDIFMLMVKKNFTYLDGFEDAVSEYFETLPDEVILSKEFSNARFVRNLFERTWGKAVLRAQLNKDDASVLTKEDFLLASSEKEFKKIMIKQSRALGFI